MTKKNIIILVTVTIVVLLAAGSIFLFTKKSHSKQNFNPSIVELNKVSINTGDWQTYKNYQYSFEIKGPKSWEIKPNSDSGLLDGEGAFLWFKPDSNGDFYAPVSMAVLDNPDNFSITKWFLKNNAKYTVGPENFIEINIPTTEEAVAVYVNFINSQGIYKYYVKKNEKIFSFDLMDTGSNIINEDAMINAIVNTLRFNK
ncbi:MAG TPA: hypothetical protein VMC41_04045 [Candidatus Nanoarchaeia archaeon]|nr:hypothetical protein [Candidatus Nanoarchaeia archaeon]